MLILLVPLHWTWKNQYIRFFADGIKTKSDFIDHFVELAIDIF